MPSETHTAPPRPRAVRTLNPAFQKLLDADSRPVPEAFRRDNPMGPGPTLVPIEQYTSRAFHELEVEKVWKRVWQVACHEDDLPEVGDYVPYDIAEMSFLIVRTSPDTIKAYYNACLHRGRKLREVRGKGATELRCPFHAWTWSLDGKLVQVPCRWDFPDLKFQEHSLPEVRTGRWGRFIFINPDPDAEPLEEFLGDLPSHFQVLPYEKRYKEAHVGKIIRCNWKIASEAFMESYHVIATHPQIILGGVNDTDTKYDAFGNYSRAIRCGALEGEALPEWGEASLDGVRRVRHPLNGWIYEATDGIVRVTTPNGKSGLFTPKAKYIEGDLKEVSAHLCDWVGGAQLAASQASFAPRAQANTAARPANPRQAMAEAQRSALKRTIPSVADDVADIEFASIFFTVFPNFHPWGSFNRIVYRFRPNGNNHEECIMECMFLAPIPENGDYTPVRDIHWLEADEDWTEASELGMLAKVFNQDCLNLPQVQKGLHATGKKHIQFADYNELKLRHFHQVLDRYIEA